jgi:uncharacterized protein YdeI (BOF family)
MKQIRQVLLFAVCTLAVALWAQQSQTSQPAQTDEHQHIGQGHSHGPMSVDEHLQMLSQKLNLTDDQKAKVRPILEEHLKERDTVMKDQSLSMEQKHEKMKASMEAAHAKIDPILNDEQKKELAQMMQDMHGEHKGMHAHKGTQPKDESTPK